MDTVHRTAKKGCRGGFCLVISSCQLLEVSSSAAFQGVFQNVLPAIGTAASNPPRLGSCIACGCACTPGTQV